MTNPLVGLDRLGQSIWYDFITRDLMASGEIRAARELEDEDVQKLADSYRKAIASIEPRLLSS